MATFILQLGTFPLQGVVSKFTEQVDGRTGPRVMKAGKRA